MVNYLLKPFTQPDLTVGLTDDRAEAELWALASSPAGAGCSAECVLNRRG